MAITLAPACGKVMLKVSCSCGALSYAGIFGDRKEAAKAARNIPFDPLMPHCKDPSCDEQGLRIIMLPKPPRLKLNHRQALLVLDLLGVHSFMTLRSDDLMGRVLIAMALNPQTDSRKDELFQRKTLERLHGIASYCQRYNVAVSWQ